MPSEDEWRMYARDLQDTKDDLYYIDSLVQRGISKVGDCILENEQSNEHLFNLDRSFGNIYKSLHMNYRSKADLVWLKEEDYLRFCTVNPV